MVDNDCEPNLHDFFAADPADGEVIQHIEGEEVVYEGAHSEPPAQETEYQQVLCMVSDGDGEKKDGEGEQKDGEGE